ncbi:MAG: hypothetical protein GKR97_14005 [Rhizobiaceae bacterium]|nr:hypothetical protein [Rhizobiaceae bacterium]
MNLSEAGIRLKQQIRIHWDSGWAALGATPLPAFAIPFFAAGLILLIRLSPVGWATEKPVQEIIAPTVLALAAGSVLLVHHWTRAKFTLMLSLFVWALFLRELHFEFMNGGILFALAGLMWWLSNVRHELVEWLSCFWIRLWLAGSFCTYFISDMMDRHLFYFLPHYRSWNDNVEETLETFGHLMVFALVLMTFKIAQNIISKKD